jgi:hypothetical protein
MTMKVGGLRNPCFASALVCEKLNGALWISVFEGKAFWNALNMSRKRQAARKMPRHKTLCALSHCFIARWQKKSKIADCLSTVFLPCTLLFLIAPGVFFYYLLRKCALRLNRNEGGTLMCGAIG